MGRFFANFTSGTAKLGNVNVGESYGASLVMKHGANVTLEVAGGKINDSHNGDGFEVWTRAEGADAGRGAALHHVRRELAFGDGRDGGRRICA